MAEKTYIEVVGARVHNLKNISVRIPRNSLTVITGLSGSGKSSLAFDTIFAEGQRRYIETFSSYARNFLDTIERPDVDSITGLSPVISIDQKTTNRNPRSTVGTVTEIYDFLRLLYARVGEAYSYLSGEKMVKYTEEKIVNLILQNYLDHRIFLLAPLIQNRKGHYSELFENLLKRGFLYTRVDGKIEEIIKGKKLDRYANHTIEVVIDKLAVRDEDRARLIQSVATAFRFGDGLLMVYNAADESTKYYSKHLMDPVTGLSYREPAPNDFSFNSAQGACPRCKGLGTVSVVDMEKIVPNPKLSIRDGGIVPLGKYKSSMIFWKISGVLENYDCTLDTPIAQLPEECMNEIIDGSEKEVRIRAEWLHSTNDYYVAFDGLAKYIHQMADSEMTASARAWAEQFNRSDVCPLCHGARLCKESLHFFINGKNIQQLSDMSLADLRKWMKDLPKHLSSTHKQIAAEIIKEITTRLDFLLNVGLDYLTLSRPSATLSGGESQRIRLATQIGSQLVNVLYILDEPSIGLHPRDNAKLIRTLQRLRDLGNTIIVVEHDREIMRHADYLVEVGPGAGSLGGSIVYQGPPQPEQYKLAGPSILPKKTKEEEQKYLTLLGATGNNLKSVDLRLPLGKLVCVAGVSGSGKSSLITHTLLPILAAHYHRAQTIPLPYNKIEGLEHLDKVIHVDQTPLGKTTRSNPATYTGVFSHIRTLFAQLPEAIIRGYKPGRFSFNAGGGRCEACHGTGQRTVEMNFLPNVYVPCEVCRGKRYNRETLEVRYRGKNIAQVLDMTIEEAVKFFENIPYIHRQIDTLHQVGLGYVRLGQTSPTLSGGESQRVKLATELSRPSTGRTLYVLDEPTTGLHSRDVAQLMLVLRRLVNKGNTVVVIEHNTEVLNQADYIIDMGPEGGAGGGTIVAQGTPQELSLNKDSVTGPYLGDDC